MIDDTVCGRATWHGLCCDGKIQFRTFFRCNIHISRDWRVGPPIGINRNVCRYRPRPTGEPTEVCERCLYRRERIRLMTENSAYEFSQGEASTICYKVSKTHRHSYDHPKCDPMMIRMAI
jgi:hypothetical protein